jgi:hypothetical protein
MSVQATIPEFRIYLREPVEEIFDAARYLDAAVSAHAAGRKDLARELIGLADMPAISDWSESLCGRGGPWTRPYPTDEATPSLSRGQRIGERMPSAAIKRAALGRDGFQCRFCSIPLITAERRDSIRAQYPDVARWGSRNAEQHSAFQAMWLQYDHVIPSSRGGSNELDNIVVTCAPCNNGRAHLTLAEARLTDPRLRAPIKTHWDGLERFRP